MSFFGWFLGNKLLTLFILATVGFGIATIVLGVQNTDLNEDLKSCENARTEPPTITTTSTTMAPTTTTSPPPVPTTTLAPPTEEPEDLGNYRLPTTVVPISYDLTLNPNLGAGTFDGEVSISLQINEPTNTVTLHSNGLNIGEVRIDGNVQEYTLDTTYELLEITTEDELEDTAELFISFNGNMRDRIVGLYVSSYTENDEER